MRLTTAITLLLIGVMNACTQTNAIDLEACLARVITNRNYQPPTPAELARARELFEHTLRGDRTAPELKKDWADAGFAFDEVVADKEVLWLVSEPAGKELGRGWYLFRTNRASTLALETPHAKNDVHTGMIGLRLFLAGQTRALATSTITRHRADMAHLDDTFFQAFTLAFAATCPTGLVIQLHGFESRNHDNAHADIIASAGTASPESWFSDLVQRLKLNTALVVLAYPHDIKELGGTLNAQGQALHKSGRCGFVHLEITEELRQRMTRDSQLRRAFLDALSVKQTR